MPFVYMLECLDGSYYTGSTVDLDQRVWQHVQGLGANFTRRHRGAKLVFFAEYESIADAFAMEKRIQGWSRAKKRALIEARWNDLPELSRRHTRYVVPDAGDGGDTAG